ncbi:hypothetical protein D3C76_622220 [compost metagenome]
MTLNRWVVLKHSYPIRDQHGKLVQSVPAEQLGRIADVDETGELLVCFPQAHISPKITDLLPAPLPDVGLALNLLREFQGHHCKSGQYQFDIKMRHFPPQSVLDKCGHEETWDEYHELLRNDLEHFMGEDFGMTRLIDWMETKWWQAGRSGGWLVIQDERQRDWEDLKATYEENSEELEAKQTTLSDRNYVRDCRTEAYNDIMELAMAIRFMGECVRIAKHQVGEYVESEEAYQSILERCAEEDEDEDDEATPGWDSDEGFQREPDLDRCGSESEDARSACAVS